MPKIKGLGTLVSREGSILSMSYHSLNSSSVILQTHLQLTRKQWKRFQKGPGECGEALGTGHWGGSLGEFDHEGRISVFPFVPHTASRPLSAYDRNQIISNHINLTSNYLWTPPPPHRPRPTFPSSINTESTFVAFARWNTSRAQE